MAAGPASLADLRPRIGLGGLSGNRNRLSAHRVARPQDHPKQPSPPFRGEREGPRRDHAGEGDVGGAAI
jgi:hypothetical protein